jgi:hypothetical protein
MNWDDFFHERDRRRLAHLWDNVALWVCLNELWDSEDDITSTFLWNAFGLACPLEYNLA